MDGLVEPRDTVKGDIARAILYVYQTYGGLLPDGEEELMLDWSKQDPVDDTECRREAMIEALQGSRNPLISECSSPEQ